jgi:tight adherence protein B
MLDLFDLPTIIFAALGAATVLVVFMLIRGYSDRNKYEIALRHLDDESPESSGVLVRGGTPLTLTPIAEDQGRRSRFDRWFSRAVMRSGLGTSPGAVVALMALLGIAAALALFYWRQNTWLAVAGGLLALLIPFTIIALLQSRHRNKLQQELPNAYYLMAGSLRAGQTLEQAIELYALRGTKPLADEFLHCAGLLKLGMSVHSALQATANRVGLLDFDLLVSTVGVYMQTGGNLAMQLDRLAASVRDRNQYRGQFLAATAQSRVVATLMACAVPLYIIAYLLFGEFFDYTQPFVSSPTGRMIILVCVILEIIGILWVWRLTRVDY